MKRKGFTLIELLAVIVILAIIALIATPIVINIINESKENANKQSGKLYEEAVLQAIHKINLNESFNPRECEVQRDGNIICDNRQLVIDVSGERPVGGKIVFDDGEVITSNILFGIAPICQAVKQAELTNGNALPYTGFNIGDEYICEVKKDTFYHFYILSTNLDENNQINSVNLIMDSNISETGEELKGTFSDLHLVAWIAKEDYKDDDNFGVDGNNNKGPLTAMKFLANATADWDDLLMQNTLLNDEFGHFTNFQVLSHARMPRYSELIGAGCLPGEENAGSCPTWATHYLFNNGFKRAIYGYWTFESFSNVNEPEESDTSRGWYIINPGYLRNSRVNVDNHRGVRPVITVPATHIKY